MRASEELILQEYLSKVWDSSELGYEDEDEEFEERLNKWKEADIPLASDEEEKRYNDFVLNELRNPTIMSEGLFKEEDMVNSPPHYNEGEVECIDAIRSALGDEGFVAYCRGNAMKYLWRCRHKGSTEQDLQKAVWYTNKSIEVLNDE